MEFVNSEVIIIDGLDREHILKKLEAVGRVCYRSSDLIGDGTDSKFVSMIKKRGHYAVLEHASITVKFVTNRAIANEVVRHRIASYAQESSRYCNYSKGKFGNQLTFIDVVEGFKLDLENPISYQIYQEWYRAMENAEKSYLKLIELGAKPDFARNVLPLSTKTELVMTMNLSSYLNFFNLRTSKEAHPEIRLLADKLLNIFEETLPEVFSDVRTL